jgi:hypothetical protein
MANSKRDDNRVPTLLAVSNVDHATPVLLEADPTTHELIVSSSGGSGGSGNGAILDGANATIKASVLQLTDANPLTVAIVNGFGDQISSFGGGTQYDEGDTASIATGTVMLWKDSGNIMSSVTATTPLPVSQLLTPRSAVVTMQNAVTATADGTSLDVSGYATAILHVEISAVAAVYFEASIDGTNWAGVTGIKQGDSIGANVLTISTNFSADFEVGVAGYKLLRARVGVYSSGTITVKGVATTATAPSRVAYLTQGIAEYRVNVETINGTSTAVNAGNVNNGTQRVVIASDQDPIEVQIISAGGASTTDLALETGGNLDIIAGAVSSSKMAVKAASGDFADGSLATLGAKGDAKSTATDTTAVSAMSVLKQISASVQAPPSQAVTNAGTFAVQATEADGANTTLGAKADAKSTATDTTAVSAMSVLKQISASVQAPPSQAVTNAGTFAVQAAQSGTWTVQPGNTANTTAWKVDGSAVTQPVSYATTGSGNATGALRVELANNGTGLVGLNAGTNAIGKLAANSGVDIGDVDVTSIIAGTGATNIGKAEDAAHTTGDTGVMMLGVRETTLTDLSAGNTDGDYEPLQVNKSGAVWVTGAPSGTSGWSVATGSIAATKTDIGTANTAGNVGGWYIYNPNASVAYVQFFNTQASGVTLGTTAPVYSLGIPATSAANVAPGMVGIGHSTAISIAVTTTRAGSTGTGSTVDYNIWYKQ